MESHRLVLEGGSADAEWRLEWDEATLALKGPDGQPVFEVPPTLAHRVVEMYDLYAEGKVGFATPFGAWTFNKHPAALAALRQLVEEGLAGDAEFCSLLRRQSLWSAAAGLAMFVVGGGLFGLYCWFASWAPDPPPGHWIRWFGFLIHGVLLVLLGAGLAGPFVTWFGLRQWLRVRQIERRAVNQTRASSSS